MDDGSTDGTVKNTCNILVNFYLKLIIHEKLWTKHRSSNRSQKCEI